MSNSFWKFGQDYSNEASISKILRNAFLKITKDDEAVTTVNDIDKKIDSLDSPKDKLIEEQSEEKETPETPVDKGSEDSLPSTEAEFKEYRPNLEILDDLLDEEEVYTELMCSNFKLLMYFKYPEVLSRLLDYIKFDEQNTEKEDEEVIEGDAEHSDLDSEDYINGTEEASEEQQSNDETNESDVSEDNSVTLPAELEEQIEVRRAHMASEILSAEVWGISNAILENDELLTKLWSILDHPIPLSIETSTYFMKINERLLDTDITGMVTFILSQSTLVARFLKHIDNPPLLDFLLKVISSDKPDAPTRVIQCLKEQGLIPRLLDCLSHEYDPSTQTAAADFLKAFVTISGNCNSEIASSIGPNELTRQLVSPEMMEKLIKIMLTGGTSLSNGVGIIIELIRKNNSDYDFVQVMYTTLETHPPNDRDPIYLGYLVSLFAQYMPEFNKFLLDTNSTMLRTSFGNITPLGFERFKVCELIAELLHCSNMSLLNEPKGEAIVKERDEERKRVLNFSHISDSGEANMNGDTTTIEGEEITERIDSLKLESEEEIRELNEKEDESSVAESSDVEAAPEDHISDSPATEKSIRDEKIVGDVLKTLLYDTGIVVNIVKMFFQFPWNNFLHNVVFDIIQQIFNGPLKTGYNIFLLKDLLTRAHLTQLLLDGDTRSREYEERTHFRLGYMGHLTLIGEEILKFAAYLEETKVVFTEDDIVDALQDSAWIEYADTILADTREKYETALGENEDDDQSLIEDGAETSRGSFDNVEIGPELLGNDVEEYYTEDNPNNFGDEEEDYNLDFNDASKFRNFGETADENEQVDENREDNHFSGFTEVQDPRYYEYIDPDGTKTRLNFSPDDSDDQESRKDGNIREGEDDQEDEDIINTKNKKDDSNSAEDAWNTATEPTSFLLNNLQRRSDPTDSTIHDETIFQHQFELDHNEIADDDDDGYLDPNDDGQSYSKVNNVLHSGMMNLQRSKNIYYDDIDENEENQLSDNSDDDDEFDPDDDDIEYAENYSSYSLCRTTSKDALWDEANPE
ncbi:hypothetical protein NCAS_0A09500 [Naumovozyma castellii]|uniref:Uncharacterized protein n=1 Tax=Naumovozyma castellii TaxID=27288 RepID=G0V7R0_NAUCA|nr:hypothetical protein NCAS_0A09500 [Naumovozyma castellii CBS 4309]CCC67508.1 hypothetical protein NCAS_0A09500 [Naumovozyma castellii CBS 4309]